MQNKSTITEQEITRRLDALPDEIADAFESDATAKVILDAGRENGLTIDKIGEVAKEVGYVMLGLITAAEFAPDLAEITGDKSKAAAVAEAINQKILLPIREAMKRTYGNEWGGDVAAGAPSTSATGPMAAPKPVEKATAQARPMPQAPPLLKPIMPPPQAPPPPPKATGSAMPKPPQARKPEPLIIRPLQSARQETPPDIPDIFKPAPPSPSRDFFAKAVEPLKTPAPAQAPAPGRASEAKPLEPEKEKPAPVISPLGIRPFAENSRDQMLNNGWKPAAAPKVESILPPYPEPKPISQAVPAPVPPPPKAAYIQAGEIVKKELDEFKASATPKTRPQAAPSLSAVTTKEDLQKEIEKFRLQTEALGIRPAETPKPQGTQPTQSKPIASPPPTSQESRPLKLPRQKIPKPPAPEKYEADPYREPAE